MGEVLLGETDRATRNRRSCSVCVNICGCMCVHEYVKYK